MTKGPVSFLRRLFWTEPAPASHLLIEELDATDVGSCACCGFDTRRVRGEVHDGSVTHALYSVAWTLGRVREDGAHFDLIVGAWGDGSSRSDRRAISLAFRRLDNGPSFMVIDATERPVAVHEDVGEALRRDQVIGTPLGQQAFDLVDAIWLHDQRIAEIVIA